MFRSPWGPTNGECGAPCAEALWCGEGVLRSEAELGSWWENGSPSGRGLGERMRVCLKCSWAFVLWCRGVALLLGEKGCW